MFFVKTGDRPRLNDWVSPGLDFSKEPWSVPVFPGVGKTHVRIEKKGRGGKVVTILYNLAMTLEEAQTLRKKLQSHYACGATLKNSQIELSGDFQDSVLQFIKNSSEK